MLSFKDYPQFTPDLTPQQVIKMGAFGGTYFRPIYSTVVQRNLKDQHLEFPFFKDVDPKYLTSSVYQKDVNYFKVSCGTSLQLWESKGWITSWDPYGWFQWYCRFYSGRRCADDVRQVKRWVRTAGPHSRFKRFYSSKVKQVMLHWAVFKKPS